MNSSQNTTGSIVGRVVIDLGQPLADAVVMITGDSPSHKDIAALTGDEGKYRFDDLIPGHYTISVNAEGYAAQTGHILVEAGAISQLNFKLTLAKQ